MTYYPRFDWCSHEWKPSGEPFKTYSRSDQGPDNPLRQAYRCVRCGDAKVQVISTKRVAA